MEHRHYFECDTIHSIPSPIPSPVFAEHPWICHGLSRILCNSSDSAISCGVADPTKSCLFARTITGTPFNFSSSRSKFNSIPLSSKRFESELSITYINAFV
eukprot:TRINITY_DN22655_c0_g1_i2.p1 TRINITY_DN22655_c0_g1~~TRINITY_DN22655_c0_g1_i2.p1  ORF type:complete len:101 (-),score=20.70 TRINITY_DN22655_c0_g1_i2:73-375(-)